MLKVKELHDCLKPVLLKLNDSEIDACWGKEMLIGVSDPGDGVGSLRLVEVFHQCFDEKLVHSRILHNDVDADGRCCFERILHFGVPAERVESAGGEVQTGDHAGVICLGCKFAPEMEE